MRDHMGNEKPLIIDYPDIPLVQGKIMSYQEMEKYHKELLTFTKKFNIVVSIRKIKEI
jgi:histidinol phosphatase-like PHP family hydrolase